jgi:glycine cleavage system H lipoate-binding protein
VSDSVHGSEDLPCIWALAGVLTYRLCDRNYRCEECELHHALQGNPMPTTAISPRGRVGSSATVDDRVAPYLRALLEGCSLHLDRPYSSGHFWLLATGTDELTVGLDDYVVRVLRPLDGVVSPGIGTWLRRDEPCGWLKRRQSAIPLRMPIAGEITAVNDGFVDRTAGEGADGGWLFHVAPHEPVDAVPSLYRGERALAWHLEKLRVLSRYLRDAEPLDAAAVGVTLNDGGVPQRDLEAVLGPDQYRRLVDELFGMQI